MTVTGWVLVLTDPTLMATTPVWEVLEHHPGLIIVSMTIHQTCRESHTTDTIKMMVQKQILKVIL